MPTARGSRGRRARPAGPRPRSGDSTGVADSSTFPAISMRSTSSSTASMSSRSWATIESSARRVALASCPTRRRRRTATTTAPPQRCRRGSGAARSRGRWRCWSGRRRAGPRPPRAVGVEHEGVGVDAAEHLGQPEPHRVDVGLGADVGLELRLGWKSSWTPSRAPASSTWLISSNSSEIARPPSASRAIARSASRKLDTESAICWAKSSVSPSMAGRFRFGSVTAHLPSYECSPQCYLVGVLEVTTHREATCQSGDA